MSVSVGVVMRKNFMRLDITTPVREAAGLLNTSGEEGALVLDESGAIVGILTQKDCFRPAVQASYYQQWRGSVGDYMSRIVKTISVDADLVAAAEMFIATSYRALPAIGHSGKPVGLVHRSDVLSALLERS